MTEVLQRGPEPVTAAGQFMASLEASCARHRAAAGRTEPLAAGPGATLADLAGRDLAIAAGDVAEALETARRWPLEITHAAAVLAAQDDQLDPAVLITALTPDGAEVRITVELTGRVERRPWHEEETGG